MSWQPYSGERRGHTWEPEEWDYLRTKFKEGETVEELAKACGRTKLAVAVKLCGLGLVEHIPSRGGYFRIGECVLNYRQAGIGNGSSRE